MALVEKRAEEITAYQRNFTPLSLMDELLDREVDDTELKGRAFSISALPVNYEVIKGLRERALRIIDHALYAEEPRIAVRAVRSLASVLAEFHPKLRMGVTKEEQTWQDAERIRVLDLLRQRLTAGNLSLQAIWKIKRSLKWTASRVTQSVEVRDSAATLLQELSRPALFDVFDVLCTNEYEENTEADGFSFPSAKRREQQNSAIASLREKIPQVEGQIRTIEQLLQQAVDATIEPKSIDSVLTQMSHTTEFLEGLSIYVLQDQQSILASVAGIAVREWRHVDVTQYARYGCLFAESPNVRMAGSVASVVSHGPPLNDPIRQDFDILTVLARRKELYVLMPVLDGLRRLSKTNAFSAPTLALITSVNVGNDHILAKEYCNVFGPYGASSTLLDSASLEKILANLVAVEELDRDAFGGFVAKVCGIAPLAIVSFFEARIAHAQTLGDNGQDSDYEAIPSSFSWSTLSAARKSADYETTLRSLRDLVKRFPEHAVHLIPIFWHIGTTDTTTFLVLDELLHAPDTEDTAWVIKLLTGAPKGLALNHPIFAIHVLTECAARSEQLERDAMGRLIGNCFSSGFFQLMPGGVRAPTQTMQDSAAALLPLCEPSSLAFRLYTEIANARQPSFPFPDVLDDFEDLDEV